MDGLLWRRLAAQRLSVPARSVEEAVHTACGLQGQDEGAARLAVRARTAGLGTSDVTRAFAGGRIVRTWAMRGTLHLLTAEDAAWMVPLLGPVFEARAGRRLAELGLDAPTLARGRDAVLAVLAEGPQPRRELFRRLAAEGLPFEGQARPHLLGHLARAGEVVIAADEVVTGFRVVPIERTVALRRLAARYLAAFGPAGARDFGAWSGLSAPDVRLAWDGVEDGPAVDVPPPRARLLGAFDNVLLGWEHRGFVLDPAFESRVRKGGVLAAMVLVDGRAAATWRVVRGARVELEWFAPAPNGVREAADADAADVLRFLEP